VNKLAWRIFEKLQTHATCYGAIVGRTDSGAKIVDAGIKARGGFELGRIVTEICLGGLGRAEITYGEYGGTELPSIFVHTDHPLLATLGSQFAGWQIKTQGYFAIGSGPARALALKPKELYEKIDYTDHYNQTIVILETEKNPPHNVVERLVQDCRVSPENLVVILTPTTSITGATQVSGRIVETGIHKLSKLGFNLETIKHAWGCAPVPPVHPKFTEAMARTNDAILYGGVAYYVVQYDDEEELERIVNEAPSSASEACGKPFLEIFKEASYDFYNVDPNLFAPSKIIVNNRRTGRIFQAGQINIKPLLKSFGF